jgi:hypothetical protein
MPFQKLSKQIRIQTGLSKDSVRLSVPVNGIVDSTQELVFADRNVDVTQSSLSEVL